MESTGGAILIDVSSGTDIEIDRTFLERLGHPVRVCHGPPHKTLCPILAGTGCPLVDEAHGIIFELDLDRPQHRAILKRYRQVVAEDVPIRAVIKPGQAEAHPEALDGIEIWTHNPSTGEMDGFAAEVEAYDRLTE